MYEPAVPVSPLASLREMGISNKNLYYQTLPDLLSLQTVERNQGEISDTGALVIKTGEFTGRSPKDRFIVKDDITTDTVDWGGFNIPLAPGYFETLKKKLTGHLNNRPELWLRDAYACADPRYRLNLRILTENSWSDLFCHNMFLRPKEEELEDFHPDWHVLQAPSFRANPDQDGTRQHNFSVISFTHKIILIGGTGYTGEIKKGVFSMLNFLLPQQGVLSMHCSANSGTDADTAIFFGLSGTGKTTLSADPRRKLIGDDEHGWAADTVFNFEGGCYAKTIDLTREKEPEIFDAIREGALLENVSFLPATKTVDYQSKLITENTRVSYPLPYISNAIEPSIGKNPAHIFFLTADAYGVLPPISKLTAGQAMYQFISGYTAKVAGTETGITEPKSTFSACFGAPFLPLHPGKYAGMLGTKIRESGATVWLINTGWSGGKYGVGSRISLNHTRAMISAVLHGSLSAAAFEQHPVFGMMMPLECPGVPKEILNPRNTWEDKVAYDGTAVGLAKEFVLNFEKFKSGVSEEILTSAPLV